MCQVCLITQMKDVAGLHHGPMQIQGKDLDREWGHSQNLLLYPGTHPGLTNSF